MRNIESDPQAWNPSRLDHLILFSRVLTLPQLFLSYCGESCSLLHTSWEQRVRPNDSWTIQVRRTLSWPLGRKGRLKECGKEEIETHIKNSPLFTPRCWLNMVQGSGTAWTGYWPSLEYMYWMREASATKTQSKFPIFSLNIFPRLLWRWSQYWWSCDAPPDLIRSKLVPKIGSPLAAGIDSNGKIDLVLEDSEWRGGEKEGCIVAGRVFSAILLTRDEVNGQTTRADDVADIMDGIGRGERILLDQRFKVTKIAETREEERQDEMES